MDNNHPWSSSAYRWMFQAGVAQLVERQALKRKEHRPSSIDKVTWWSRVRAPPSVNIFFPHTLGCTIVWPLPFYMGGIGKPRMQIHRFYVQYYLTSKMHLILYEMTQLAL